MKSHKACLAALFVGFVCLASSGSAQPVSPVVDEFGTLDGNDLWIPASRFTGVSGWLEGGVNGYFYSSESVPAVFHADLPLPQGAYLDSWRAFYYDASSANNFTIGFVKWFDDTTGAPTVSNAPISSFVSTGTPGLTNHHQVEGFTVDLREPFPGTLVTRNQAADFYTFYVVMPADFNVQFKGVRVIWHRQVSPAPATATFNDVPASDTGFQYIEALAASGITGGCGGGNYCPDATLTRRQMAIFLSKALGLHWPNF